MILFVAQPTMHRGLRCLVGKRGGIRAPFLGACTAISALQTRQCSLEAGPTTTPKRISVGQMTSTSDHSKNLEQVAKLAEMAQQDGACMLLLPEAFSFIGSHFSLTMEQAEPLEGERMEEFRKIARERNLWLSLGGFHEQMEPGVDFGYNPSSSSDDIAEEEEVLQRISNTHVILDEKGETRAVYRKVHLFDVNIPDGPVLLESRYTMPGSLTNDNVVVLDTPAGKMGLTTCYDMRFPEMYTKLAHKGAEIILVPSAFTVPTGKAHWHLLLRARAVETQCFVLASAQVKLAEAYKTHDFCVPGGQAFGETRVVWTCSGKYVLAVAPAPAPVPALAVAHSLALMSHSLRCLALTHRQ